MNLWQHLDPIVVQDIQKYILKLQNFGCAILVTDHQVNNLFDIVDRAYVLGEQSIIAQGTPAEILKSSKAIELAIYHLRANSNVK